jgi:hypothetical protein
MHVSLDGFVCGPGDEMDWTTMDDDGIGSFYLIFRKPWIPCWSVENFTRA